MSEVAKAAVQHEEKISYYTSARLSTPTCARSIINSHSKLPSPQNVPPSRR